MNSRLSLMGQNHSDMLETPEYAMIPLLEYIDKSKVIWEPACGSGHLVNAFVKHGYVTWGTDIEPGFRFHVADFLSEEIEWDWDVIVTNPPYSLKNEFLKRCYDFGKPFALLLTVTSLESHYRQELFKKNGLGLLLLDKRVNFIGSKNSVWFSTAWFCHGLGFDGEIKYATINRK